MPLQESVAALLGEIVSSRGSAKAHDDVSILAVELSLTSGCDNPVGGASGLSQMVE